MEQITAPASSDSITSRPFISSPRQQPAVTRQHGDGASCSQAASRPLLRLQLQSIPRKAAAAANCWRTPPVIVGNNLTWNVGTLPAGQSVTITFQVTVNTPPPSFTQVSNQGTVTADGGINRF